MGAEFVSVDMRTNVGHMTVLTGTFRDFTNTPNNERRHLLHKKELCESHLWARTSELGHVCVQNWKAEFERCRPLGFVGCIVSWISELEAPASELLMEALTSAQLSSSPLRFSCLYCKLLEGCRKPNEALCGNSYTVKPHWLVRGAKLGKKEIYTELWWGNDFGNFHLEYWVVSGR